MKFKKSKCKEQCNKKPEPEFQVKESVFDYIEKTATFSEKFIIEAIVEKAARERLLIGEIDLKAHWHDMTNRYSMYVEGWTPKASITWKEKR